MITESPEAQERDDRHADGPTTDIGPTSGTGARAPRSTAARAAKLRATRPSIFLLDFSLASRQPRLPSIATAFSACPAKLRIWIHREALGLDQLEEVRGHVCLARARA